MFIVHNAQTVKLPKLFFGKTAPSGAGNLSNHFIYKYLRQQNISA